MIVTPDDLMAMYTKLVGRYKHAKVHVDVKSQNMDVGVHFNNHLHHWLVVMVNKKKTGYCLVAIDDHTEQGNDSAVFPEEMGRDVHKKRTFQFTGVDDMLKEFLKCVEDLKGLEYDFREEYRGHLESWIDVDKVARIEEVGVPIPVDPRPLPLPIQDWDDFTEEKKASEKEERKNSQEKSVS